MPHSNPEKVYQWNIENSTHASKRIEQRGLSNEILYLAMDYGIPIFKQGLIFYVVTRKTLPVSLKSDLYEKLDNLVVVVSPDTNEIVTCYKSNNGLKHIKKKSKRLAG